MLGQIGFAEISRIPPIRFSLLRRPYVSILRRMVPAGRGDAKKHKRAS
jgi:hypothetical protein